MRMLRAISEIAVAIRVRSPGRKPSSVARARPCWRAMTMSISDTIGTSVSVSTGRRGARSVEGLESLFQVESGQHAFQPQTELDHGEGDLRLDSDDHRLRPSQLDHVGQVSKGAAGKGVHHVERGHVHDHSSAPQAADLFGQLIAELDQVGIGEGGLYRGNQDVALLEDWDLHDLVRRG